MKNKESGFGLVGVVVILLVVAAVAFAGWYVWSKGKEDKTVKTTTTESPAKKDTPAEPDILIGSDTRDWVTYSNAEGDFSFKHPKSWVLANNLELCTDGLVLFAADKASVGTCASEGGGQMAVYSSSGDFRSDYALSTGYKNVGTSDVTVHGVTGTKQVGTVEGQEDGEGIPGYPNGTVVTQYAFYTGGRTLIATYVQQPSYPNVLVDFNTLVMSTLNFTE